MPVSRRVITNLGFLWLTTGTHLHLVNLCVFHFALDADGFLFLPAIVRESLLVGSSRLLYGGYFLLDLWILRFGPRKCGHQHGGADGCAQRALSYPLDADGFLLRPAIVRESLLVGSSRLLYGGYFLLDLWILRFGPRKCRIHKSRRK